MRKRGRAGAGRLRSTEYDELLSGGPPRNGIPSIDEPRFVGPGEAAGWLADNEPVIALGVGLAA